MGNITRNGCISLSFPLWFLLFFLVEISNIPPIAQSYLIENRILNKMNSHSKNIDGRGGGLMLYLPTPCKSVHTPMQFYSKIQSNPLSQYKRKDDLPKKRISSTTSLIFNASTGSGGDEVNIESTKGNKNSNTMTMEKNRKLRKSVGDGFGVKRAKTKTVNARLIKEINRELEAKEAEAEEYNTKPTNDFESTLTEEEKQRKAEKERIEKQDEEALADLNGINPRFALFGSGFTLFLAFVFWRITQGMAVTFNNLHIETDIYPVQRVANTASTALIGLAALGTGIFGGIGLGLTALTTRIIYGVVTGELDPNKPRKATSKEIEEEMERRNPSMVDKEGKVKFTKPWWEETFDDTEERK